MKILLLFPHFNSLEEASSLRSWQIGRYLAEKGHDVNLLAPGVDLRSGQIFPKMEGRLYNQETQEGVNLVRIRSLTNFRQSRYRRLGFELVYGILSSIKSITFPNIDVAVLAYPPAIAPFFMYFASKLKRDFPIIFEMRDLMADAMLANGYVNKEIFHKFGKYLENHVANHSDHVICVSDGIKRELQSCGVNPTSISVVPNGYEPEVFKSTVNSENPRSKYNWGDRFVVIYAGGLTQSYDIPTLLRAAKRLQEEEFLFVIVGEGERKKDYKKYCKKHGLENCQFIDYQPRKKMPSFFNDADLGVHLFPNDPVWSYVLGNKAFDYLGSGLPMLYAGTGDTANLIRKAKAGKVVEPENDRELAKAIKWFKSNQKKAEQMGKNGREYVKENYYRPDLNQQFEHTLFDVVSDWNTNK